MKQLTGNQVRQMFLDYFKSKGHMIEPGASLIPHNDPTLLWINAGVAALKNILMVVKNQHVIVLQMHKNQFVQTILKMLVKQQDIILSLKC